MNYYKPVMYKVKKRLGNERFFERCYELVIDAYVGYIIHINIKDYWVMAL